MSNQKVCISNKVSLTRDKVSGISLNIKYVLVKGADIASVKNRQFEFF